MQRISVAAGGVPFAVSITDGHHRWLADEPSDLGGGDVGPSPEALLLSSLGACTAITLRMYAARKHWSLRQVLIDLSLRPPPKDGSRPAEIELRVDLQGQLDEAQRERLLQIAKACPTHRLLTGPVVIAARLGSAERL